MGEVADQALRRDTSRISPRNHVVAAVEGDGAERVDQG